MFKHAKSITMRHEEKYICSDAYLTILESRLQGFLASDVNQGADGYEIRSLYFDTLDERLYEDGVQGLAYRNKYRIRIYNCNSEIIKLEKKTSIKNLKKKATVLVDQSYVNSLIVNDNQRDVLDFDKNELLMEFVELQQTAMLRPKIIVEYNRKAFVSDMGNIRVTLDRNIRASAQLEDFFSKDIAMIPVLPQGVHLLEVKYDGIFPGYLSRLINFDNLQRTSFSKYVLSTEVIKNNGRTREIYEF